MRAFKKTLAGAVDRFEKGVENVTALRATKDYKLGEQVASGGPGLLWKIYSAQSKKPKPGSPVEVSVWILDKKSLYDENRQPKANTEKLLEVFRKEGAQLLKLRHPGVIRLLEPLEETRAQMGLVTESVFASIANVLDKNTVPNPPTPLANLELSPVELKHGLLQLTEVLTFLHSDAKIVHRAISPESVFIAGGSWKFGGLGFSTAAQFIPSSQEPVFTKDQIESQETQIPTTPPLRYMAPELLTAGPPLSTHSDIFSYGALVFEVMYQQPLLPAVHDLSKYYESIAEIPNTLARANVDPNLYQWLFRMLSQDPGNRPDASSIILSPFFSADPELQVLSSLGELLRYDNLQKAGFIRQVSQVWHNFDARVLRYKVLPPLLAEVRNEAVQGMVLPLVLTIAEKQTQSDFVQCTLPVLTPLLGSVCGESHLLLLRHAASIANNLPIEMVEQHILPLLTRSCDSSDPRVQEEAVRQVAKAAAKLGYAALKGTLMPRVHNLVMSTRTAGVRVNALVCYGHLVPKLDKGEVEKITDTLGKVVAVDKSPPTLMCALGVCDIVSKNFGPEVTAGHVLPLLAPLLMAPRLSSKQFTTFAGMLKDMLDRLQEARLPALQEAEAVKHVTQEECAAGGAEGGGGGGQWQPHEMAMPPPAAIPSSPAYAPHPAGARGSVDPFAAAPPPTAYVTDPFAASGACTSAPGHFPTPPAAPIDQGLGQGGLLDGPADGGLLGSGPPPSAPQAVSGGTPSMVDQLASVLSSPEDLENLFVADGWEDPALELPELAVGGMKASPAVGISIGGGVGGASGGTGTVAGGGLSSVGKSMSVGAVGMTSGGMGMGLGGMGMPGGSMGVSSGSVQGGSGWGDMLGMGMADGGMNMGGSGTTGGSGGGDMLGMGMGGGGMNMGTGSVGMGTGSVGMGTGSDGMGTNSGGMRMGSVGMSMGTGSIGMGMGGTGLQGSNGGGAMLGMGPGGGGMAPPMETGLTNAMQSMDLLSGMPHPSPQQHQQGNAGSLI